MTVLAKKSLNAAPTQALWKLLVTSGCGTRPAPAVKAPSWVLKAVETTQRNGYAQMKLTMSSRGTAIRFRRSTRRQRNARRWGVSRAEVGGARTATATPRSAGAAARPGEPAAPDR